MTPGDRAVVILHRSQAGDVLRAAHGDVREVGDGRIWLQLDSGQHISTDADRVFPEDQAAALLADGEEEA